MSWLDTFNTTFKSVRKKIKALLRRQRWNEALIFFFFVLLSLGFWMLQSLQQDYEIEFSIPVRYKNVPPDIAFTTTPPEAIRVKVKDKGSVLLNYTIGRAFTPIDIAMKKNSLNGELNVSRKEIESDIQKQLLATTTLQNFEPQSISLKYNPRKKKMIPVIFNGDIQTDAGFFADDILINPAQVEVYGSEELLDTLTFIRTRHIIIKNAKKAITENISLEKINGAVVVPEFVTLTAKIEEYTEKTLDIPVTCTDLPNNLTLRTFPSTVKVTCSIPLSRFKELAETDFAIIIPYSELEHNANGIIQIEISHKPNWVKQTTLSPEKIEFVLEQNELSHD